MSARSRLPTDGGDRALSRMVGAAHDPTVRHHDVQIRYPGKRNVLHVLQAMSSTGPELAAIEPADVAGGHLKQRAVRAAGVEPLAPFNVHRAALEFGCTKIAAKLVRRFQNPDGCESLPQQFGADDAVRRAPFEVRGRRRGLGDSRREEPTEENDDCKAHVLTR